MRSYFQLLWGASALTGIFFLPIGKLLLLFLAAAPALRFLKAKTWLENLNLVLLSLCFPLALLDFYSSAAAGAGGLCSEPVNVHEAGQEVQRLKPGVHATCRKYRAFTHELQIDNFGRRFLPAAPESKRNRVPVLFLGCSYTIGIGVNDSETFVNRAQLALQNQFRFYNAALPGTGPATMLRLLERKEAYLPGLPPRIPLGFYTFFPDHIARVNGVGSWRIDDPEQEVPEYHLEGGSLHYAGSIGNRTLPRFLSRKFSPVFVKKLAYYFGIYEHYWRQRRAQYYSQEELELTKAVIRETARRFQENYGGKLVMVLWTNHPLQKQLEDLGFFRELSQELAVVAYPHPEELSYIPNDRHPSPLAHLKLGDFFTKLTSRLGNATAPGNAL